MTENNSSENTPKPNGKPAETPSEKPANGQTEQQQTAPGATEGAAAGTEVAQSGENVQQPAQQLASSGEALKKANEKAMKAAIPFAIGLESLPADALRKDTANATAAGTGGVGGGGVFPSSAGSGGIDIALKNATLDGYFNSDSSLKQLVCPMTCFQSFPVTKAGGIITRITDHTSTGDNAGTDCGRIGV